MPVNARWGFRKIKTFPYPLTSVASSHGTINLPFDLKDVLQTPVLGKLMIRVVGNITIAGAGAGVATGRDNPTALLPNFTLQTTPSMGVIAVNNMSPAGLKDLTMVDRGYDISPAAIVDAAGVVAVDFSHVLNFRLPSYNSIEWGMPLSMYTNALLTLNVGGRDQLFTGGVNTWDLSGLRIELWADFDNDVSTAFHVVETFERTFNITASQSDFDINKLEPGYIYTHLLFRTERDNLRVNDILNSITIRGAGREWLPQGDGNALQIQRWNRENTFIDPAVSQTGRYYIPALRGGQYTNGIDALDSQLEVKCDVTFGAGVQKLFVVGRRIIPQKLLIASSPVPVVATAPAGK